MQGWLNGGAKRLATAALSLGALTTTLAHAADDKMSSVNMSPGVTEVGQSIFDLHMAILWICVVIGVACSA
jgi:cytochrome c oxidase subunit 2